MFVSYRRGDRVYWTSHRVRVPRRGISPDRRNEHHSRPLRESPCEIPQEPVEARDQQPSEGELAQIEEIATTLPMAPMSIPSPLDPPSGGYAGQTSNTAAPTTAAQQRGATRAVARSWSPFMNGVSGLVVPKATVPSGTSESFVASEINVPEHSTPVTGSHPSRRLADSEPKVQETGGIPRSTRRLQDNARSGSGGAGSGPFSKSETVGYLVAVGPPEAGATASAWYEGPPPTSGGEGPDGVGALAADEGRPRRRENDLGAARSYSGAIEPGANCPGHGRDLGTPATTRRAVLGCSSDSCTGLATYFFIPRAVLGGVIPLARRYPTIFP
jgi:hypothetical protein